MNYETSGRVGRDEEVFNIYLNEKRKKEVRSGRNNREQKLNYI